MNIEQFINALKEKGIVLTDKQLKQFDTYYHTSGATGEPKELKQLVDRLKSL